MLRARINKSEHHDQFAPMKAQKLLSLSLLLLLLPIISIDRARGSATNFSPPVPSTTAKTTRHKKTKTLTAGFASGPVLLLFLFLHL